MGEFRLARHRSRHQFRAAVNFPPGPPVLETPRLRLRPFVSADTAAVQRLAGAAEVADTTARLPHPYADGMAEQWIATHAAQWESGHVLVLALTLRDSGELVGCAGLTFDRANERAELGYWIGVPYWRRGYATEGASVLVDYGFRVLGLQRIQAHHFARNPASGRVMLKLGMKREGFSPRAMKKNDRFEDVIFYGVLRRDWPSTSSVSPSRAPFPG